MMEFLSFIETLARAGWVFFLALLGVATGLFLFDRRPRKKSAAADAEQTRRRLAA